MTAYRPVLDGTPSLTVKSRRTCFMFYCMFYVTCDRSLNERCRRAYVRTQREQLDTRNAPTVGPRYSLRLKIDADDVFETNARRRSCDDRRTSTTGLYITSTGAAAAAGFSKHVYKHACPVTRQADITDVNRKCVQEGHRNRKEKA